MKEGNKKKCYTMFSSVVSARKLMIVIYFMNFTIERITCVCEPTINDYEKVLLIKNYIF